MCVIITLKRSDYMLKEYKKDLFLLIMVAIIMYILPINLYLTSKNPSEVNYNTLIFVANNLAIFIGSIIEARYKRLFYIFPLIASVMFMPLPFILYSQSYLACIIMYIFVGLLGGLVGLWFRDNEEAVKSFKKAFGIMFIVGSIFTIIINTTNIILPHTDSLIYSDLTFDLTVGSINVYICVLIMILLSIRCLKKKKKKGAKK